MRIRLGHSLAEYSRHIGLAALSGIFSILIFPGFNIELLAWVAFIPLFAAIQNQQDAVAFRLGWFMGCLHFLGTLYWVTVTMVRYGHLSQTLSIFALVLMVVYLALYPGTFCLILRYLDGHTSLPLFITAPVVWTGVEYLRSFFLIGFPWNTLGYCQFLTPGITQIADITGVYGVSFLIMLVNAGLYSVLFTPLSRGLKLKTAFVTLGCLALCLGYGKAKLPADNAAPGSEGIREQKITVAVIQGNIEQSIKWDQEYRQSIFEKYVNLSRGVLPEQPDIIIWPETSVPFLVNYDQSYRQQLINTVQALDTPLLFGGLDLIILPEPEKYRTLNSAFLMSPNGHIISKYDKIRLVPFGEYVPFQHVLFFVEHLTTAIGRVQPGREHNVMSYGRSTFSAVICFEIIFPDLVRKFVDNGAQFLINITNDAWFGKTAAAYQHFAMVTFRAIENRVSIARAANTGISGFIDPYGRILEQSDIFVEDALVHDINVRTTTTLYTQYGDVLARACFGMLALWLGFAWYHSRSRRNKKELNG